MLPVGGYKLGLFLYHDELEVVLPVAAAPPNPVPELGLPAPVVAVLLDELVGGGHDCESFQALSTLLIDCVLSVSTMGSPLAVNSSIRSAQGMLAANPGQVD